MSSIHHAPVEPNIGVGISFAPTIAVIITGAKLMKAINEDVQNKSSRNTVEAVVNLGTCWTGGLLGGCLGKFIGNKIKPGGSEKISEFIGSFIGSVLATVATTAIVNPILESNRYDMKEVACELCNKQFSARIYRGEKLCINCKSIFIIGRSS